MIKDIIIVLRSRFIENEVSLKVMYEAKCSHCGKLVEEHKHDKMGQVQGWDFYHTIYKTSCKDTIKILGVDFYRYSSPMGFGLSSMKYWAIKRNKYVYI